MGLENFIPSAESFRRNWKYHLLMGSIRPTSVKVGQKPGRGASCSLLLSQPFSVVGTPLTKPNLAFDLHIGRKMLLTLGELGSTWWDLRPMSVSRGTQENVLPRWGGESCPDPAVPTPGQVLSEPQAGPGPPITSSPLVVGRAPCCSPNRCLLTYFMLPIRCSAIAAICKMWPFFGQPCLLSPDWPPALFHLLPPIHQCPPVCSQTSLTPGLRPSLTLPARHECHPKPSCSALCSHNIALSPFPSLAAPRAVLYTNPTLSHDLLDDATGSRLFFSCSQVLRVTLVARQLHSGARKHLSPRKDWLFAKAAQALTAPGWL